MSPLMDEDGNEVLSEDALSDPLGIFYGVNNVDEIDETLFLVPSGLTIKAGFGITF